MVDTAGATQATFTMTDLSTESIVVALELYRRQGTWKVAVGQGYAGGLADLIRDHGVSVDDAAPSGQSPPPAASHPPAPPSAHPQPPAPTPAPAGAGEVTLTKGRTVSLTKGQRVSLTKEGGCLSLSVVRMGLGWDPVRKKSGLFGSREVQIDLDASCVFADRQAVDVAFYNQLRTKDGSVQRLGDNRTGAGEGDDEVVMVDLARVPVHVNALFFIVTSYEGHTFENVQNASADWSMTRRAPSSLATPSPAVCRSPAW